MPRSTKVLYNPTTRARSEGLVINSRCSVGEEMEWMREKERAEQQSNESANEPSPAL